MRKVGWSFNEEDEEREGAMGAGGKEGRQKGTSRSEWREGRVPTDINGGSAGMQSRGAG